MSYKRGGVGKKCRSIISVEEKNGDGEKDMLGREKLGSKKFQTLE